MNMAHTLSGLLDLPEELLAEILLYLDCRTILRCLRACRRLYAIIDTSKALKYIIGLALIGTIDVSSSMLTRPLSTGEGVALLTARRRRRLHFEPEKLFSSELQCPSDDYVWNFANGVFSLHYPDNDSTYFTAYYLPSHRNEAPQLQAKVRFEHHLLRDHCIDPSRDLFACLQVLPHLANPSVSLVYVHLLSISGRAVAHPEATKRRLDMMDATSEDDADTTLYLAGDYVAYLSPTTLCIWCWTTGSLLIVSIFPARQYRQELIRRLG
ncbi:hypothetical protein PENSPDRAFT_264449 [Peniophora sp. CONT]|nr:hypothetical protein PENSPDRAFT_264449 [Peniophora sp. CONT]